MGSDMSKELGISDEKIVSDAIYNFIIGTSLMWGLLLNFIAVKSSVAEFILTYIGFMGMIILYFALAFSGVYIFNKSKEPMISLLGYSMVAFAFGLILELCLLAYDSSVIFPAIVITGGVTIIMMILGSLFPAFFFGIVRMLTLSLLAVIIIELVLFFFFRTQLVIIDYIVIVIFCGYIGYDWGKANAVPKTVDNAIDSAANIYMDILNLFLRILRILGRK